MKDKCYADIENIELYNSGEKEGLDLSVENNHW